MPQTHDEQQAKQAADTAHEAAAGGPSAADLKKQGQAATSRVVGDGPSIFGMNGFPVGKPLYITKGQVHGFGMTAGVTGQATVSTEDADHLVVHLTQVDVSKFHISVSKDDVVDLSFTRDSNDTMAFSSTEKNKNKNAQGELHLVGAPTANLIQFQDKDGKAGSITWDESKQELTIRYAGNDNIMVLSPNKK